MDTDAPHQRPRLVTVAVVLWFAVLAVDLIRTSVQHTRELRTQSAVATLILAAIGLAFTAWFVYGAVRVGRGSGRARFWMAVVGVFSFIGALIPPYGLATVTGLLGGVAGWLPYLPEARAFYPQRQRGPRRPQQRVTGWDPDTGEPIRATD